MKKFILPLFAFLPLLGLAQNKAWITPKPTNAEDSVTIYVDISKFDNALEHTQLLLQAAAAGEDLYIWTWKPAELPASSPKTNGIGDRPWQNSNEILKLTKQDDNIYYYKMIPTEFYEVPAPTVYQNGIHFLVKPKNGGGYGDPDIKSEDLSITVVPDIIIKGITFNFPNFITNDQSITTVVYQNSIDTLPAMANLGEDNCYLFMEATLDDGTKLRLSNFAQAGTIPEYKMTKRSDGNFYLIFVPRDFFNVPADRTVTAIACTPRKRVYTSVNDQSKKFEFEIKCP
jgi:hypothetical protein